MAGRERAFNRVDVFGVGNRGERGIALEQGDVHPHGRQDGCRISAAAADHERTLARLRRDIGEQLAEHSRSAEKTAPTERNSSVGIGQRPSVRRDELLAGNAAHRIEQCAVGHALGAQLAVDHRRAGFRIVGNR